MEQDSYLTLAAAAQASLRERGSRFLAFAYPVTCEQEIRGLLDTLHKTYYDATHHCYAWRLGPAGGAQRINDDGEPSGTAGRPIMGQMLSAGITDALVVVVRYFGGTKLGVPGLIAAYKGAAAAAIEAGGRVERTVEAMITVRFSFAAMNAVMRIVKEEQPRIVAQQFDNLCTMTLAVRRSRTEVLVGKLQQVEGAQAEELKQ